MNPINPNPVSIVNQWLTSLIRIAIAGIGGFFVRKGWIDNSLWESTVAIIIAGGISAFWALFEKWKVKQHVVTALAMPQGSSVTLLDKVIKADVPITPGDTTSTVLKKVDQVL